MSCRLIIAALAVLAARTAAGCGSSTTERVERPRVAASSAGVQVDPVDRHEVERTARAFMRSYLRAEVDEDRPGDRELLAQLSTGNVAELLSVRPREPLDGFPPAGRLVAVRGLPVLTPGRWVLEASVVRAGRGELYELQLTSGGRGPQIDTFTSTGETDAP